MELCYANIYQHDKRSASHNETSTPVKHAPRSETLVTLPIKSQANVTNVSGRGSMITKMDFLHLRGGEMQINKGSYSPAAPMMHSSHQVASHDAYPRDSQVLQPFDLSMRTNENWRPVG